MIYGLLTTKAIIIFQILLILLLFDKNKKITVLKSPSIAYRLCTVMEMIHFVLQVAALYALKYIGNNLFFQTLYIFHFVTAIAVWEISVLNLLTTVYDIKAKTTMELLKYNAITKSLVIGLFLFTIFLYIPPITKLLTDISLDNLVFYTNFGRLILSSMFIAIPPMLILVYVKRNQLTKEYKIGMCTSCISSLAAVVLQIIFPNFAILQFGIVVTNYVYFSLLESPDILIMNEIKENTSDNEETSKLITNIPSNINLPLNKMQESYRKIKNTKDIELIKKNIKIINESGNEFIDIVNNVIESSQTSSDNLKINDRKYETKELIKNIINHTTEKLGEKKVRLVVRVSPTVSSILFGDYTKLIKILTNIMNFACSNTDLGKIIITISSSKGNNVETLTFKISDTGHGIKDEEKETVFKSITEKTAGLKVSKEYTELLGGKIWFESLEEAGTKFYVQIPQKIMDLTPVGELSKILETKNIEEIDFSKYKILIVDDNILNTKVTKHYLDKYKFNIDLSYSGKDCIYKIKSGEKYDAIFLDIAMPGIDGIETLKVLSYIGETTETKMFALSANNSSIIKEEYLSKGFDEFIEKPIRTKLLENILKQHFK